MKSPKIKMQENNNYENCITKNKLTDIQVDILPNLFNDCATKLANNLKKFFY